MLAKDKSDGLRLKVREALRRSIESVTCLFVRAGGVSLAAVQVHFRGSDQHRDYLIYFKQSRGNGRMRRREGETRTWSLADVAALGPLDLRKRADTKKLEAALAGLDLSNLAGD
jgi:hypothetical protein